jgi:uncharacterized coiled-coil DUF342 family protein
MTKIRKKDLHFTIMRLRERVNHSCIGVNDNAQEIKNILRTLRLHGEGHMTNDLTPQFREMCKRVEAVRDRMDVLESQGTHTCHNLAALKEDQKRIIAIELKMKEQRSDYHDHIRQLVEENNAAHEMIRKNSNVARECSNAQATEILKMKEQIKGLENRLSRAQDTIAEMHKDGFIPVKKPAGRPKKGE